MIKVNEDIRLRDRKFQKYWDFNINDFREIALALEQIENLPPKIEEKYLVAEHPFAQLEVTKYNISIYNNHEGKFIFSVQNLSKNKDILSDRHYKMKEGKLVEIISE